ncbi:hypothetical protein ACO2Q8_00460 [Larkinella sp. VNQ87]|uniref:hypothetical protein n=1 Tax=Larkinella sp. VNQ87 TaxID=3400921 RepID=UPI003C0625E2
MNSMLLPFLLVLACGLASCSPDEKTLVVSTHNGHSLTLTDHTTMVGVGMYRHQPTLTFDGKLVSDQNVGFPLLTERYPQWIILEYDSARTNREAQPWTVYVSPAAFNLAEFNQIAACFDARRPDFNAALAAIQTTAYPKTDRIARLVYGEAPRTMVFRPEHPRYQRTDGMGTDTEERLTIDPDGKWVLQVVVSDGAGLRMTANLAHGTMVAKNGQMSMEKPLQTRDPAFIVRPPMADLSDAAYLQSFADSTGQSLLSVVRYPY